jgi:hypothetical protein
MTTSEEENVENVDAVPVPANGNTTWVRTEVLRLAIESFAKRTPISQEKIETSLLISRAEAFRRYILVGELYDGSS